MFYLNPITPQRSAFRVEACCLENPFNSGVSGMNLCAHSKDSTLLCIFQQRCDECAADSLSAPLRRHEQGDDIHRFAAKFGAPFVRSIGIAAECSFIAFSDDDESAIRGVHDVIEDTPCILGGSFRPDVRQKFTRQFTQRVQIFRLSWSNLERLYTHSGYPAGLLYYMDATSYVPHF